MKVNRENKKPSTSLRNTHFQITPFYSSEDGRFIALCFCGFHKGLVHPSAYYGDKHCTKGCLYIQKYSLPDRGLFDLDEINRAIDESRKIHRTSPTLPVDYLVDEETGAKYLWVLDRGERVYVPHLEKIALISDIERDHFKLFI